MSAKQIAQLFASLPFDEARHATVSGIAEPNPRYLIAMTPRSGSSHLCDVLKNTGRLGRPGEMLSREFIPNIVKSAPGRNPDEYLDQVMRVIRTPNGVSGLKASWFQFDHFRGAMSDPSVLSKFKVIYLTRRNLAAQAVSLYCATASNVFHTNVQHSSDERGRLERLDYDFALIRQWYQHIVVQERGWQRYFAELHLNPLCITYEDIEDDVVAVVHRIAHYIGRPRASETASSDSIFRKIGNRRNVEWAAQFMLDLDAHERANPPPQP